MLIEKIKQWEKRKAAQVLLQNACKTWLYKTIYRKKLGGIRTIQHVKRSKAIDVVSMSSASASASQKSGGSSLRTNSGICGA